MSFRRVGAHVAMLGAAAIASSAPVRTTARAEELPCSELCRSYLGRSERADPVEADQPVIVLVPERERPAFFPRRSRTTKVGRAAPVRRVAVLPPGRPVVDTAAPAFPSPEPAALPPEPAALPSATAVAPTVAVAPDPVREVPDIASPAAPPPSLDVVIDLPPDTPDVVPSVAGSQVVGRAVGSLSEGIVVTIPVEAPPKISDPDLKVPEPAEISDPELNASEAAPQPARLP